MSYARFGEQGSTVYAYPTGDDHYEIWAYGEPEPLELHGLENFHTWMVWLQLGGEQIPPSVFKRIEAELRGEDPYGDYLRDLMEQVRADHAAHWIKQTGNRHP